MNTSSATGFVDIPSVPLHTWAQQGAKPGSSQARASCAEHPTHGAAQTGIKRLAKRFASLQGK